MQLGVNKVFLVVPNVVSVTDRFVVSCLVRTRRTRTYPRIYVVVSDLGNTTTASAHFGKYVPCSWRMYCANSCFSMSE